MIEPRTPRAYKAAVTRSPKKKTIRSGESSRGFNVQPVASLFSRRLALSIPISAMNKPMPMAMPLRMLGLMASMSFSRTPSIDNSRNKTPE